MASSLGQVALAERSLVDPFLAGGRDGYYAESSLAFAHSDAHPRSDLRAFTLHGGCPLGFISLECRDHPPAFSVRKDAAGDDVAKLVTREAAGTALPRAGAHRGVSHHAHELRWTLLAIRGATRNQPR